MALYFLFYSAIPSISTAEKPKKEEKVEKQGTQERQTEKTRNPKIKPFWDYFQVSFFRSDCKFIMKF